MAAAAGLGAAAGLVHVWCVVRDCSDSFKKDKDDDRHTARSVLNLDTSEGRELLRRLSSVSSGVSAPCRADPLATALHALHTLFDDTPVAQSPTAPPFLRFGVEALTAFA